MNVVLRESAREREAPTPMMIRTTPTASRTKPPTREILTGDPPISREESQASGPDPEADGELGLEAPWGEFPAGEVGPDCEIGRTLHCRTVDRKGKQPGQRKHHDSLLRFDNTPRLVRLLGATRLITGTVLR